MLHDGSQPNTELLCENTISVLRYSALNIQYPEHTGTPQGRKEPEDYDPVLPAASRKLLGKRLQGLFDLQNAEKGVRGRFWKTLGFHYHLQLF